MLLAPPAADPMERGRPLIPSLPLGDSMVCSDGRRQPGQEGKENGSMNSASKLVPLRNLAKMISHVNKENPLVLDQARATASSLSVS